MQDNILLGLTGLASDVSTLYLKYLILKPCTYGI